MLLHGKTVRWTENLPGQSSGMLVCSTTMQLLLWLGDNLSRDLSLKKSLYTIYYYKGGGGWAKVSYLTIIMRVGCWISDDVGWHLVAGPMKPCLVLESPHHLSLKQARSSHVRVSSSTSYQTTQPHLQHTTWWYSNMPLLPVNTGLKIHWMRFCIFCIH